MRTFNPLDWVEWDGEAVQAIGEVHVRATAPVAVLVTQTDHRTGEVVTALAGVGTEVRAELTRPFTWTIEGQATRVFFKVPQSKIATDGGEVVFDPSRRPTTHMDAVLNPSRVAAYREQMRLDIMKHERAALARERAEAERHKAQEAESKAEEEAEAHAAALEAKAKAPKAAPPEAAEKDE